MTRDDAFQEIARLAAEHSLIAKAGGGIITVVAPGTQRQFGLEAQCLYMAGKGPHPLDNRKE